MTRIGVIGPDPTKSTRSGPSIRSESERASDRNIELRTNAVPANTSSSENLSFPPGTTWKNNHIDTHPTSRPWASAETSSIVAWPTR